MGPHDVHIVRTLRAPPAAIYRAWTTGFDTWFAAPGSVTMRPLVGEPFVFETEFEGGRHPHFGRFRALEPDRRVELTWVTAATAGVETTVALELEPAGTGTRVRLTHRGFPNEAAVRRHADAWPKVLAHLDDVLAPGR